MEPMKTYIVKRSIEIDSAGGEGQPKRVITPYTDNRVRYATLTRAQAEPFLASGAIVDPDEPNGPRLVNNFGRVDASSSPPLSAPEVPGEADIRGKDNALPNSKAGGQTGDHQGGPQGVDPLKPPLTPSQDVPTAISPSPDRPFSPPPGGSVKPGPANANDREGTDAAQPPGPNKTHGKPADEDQNVGTQTDPKKPAAGGPVGTPGPGVTAKEK